MCENIDAARNDLVKICDPFVLPELPKKLPSQENSPRPDSDNPANKVPDIMRNKHQRILREVLELLPPNKREQCVSILENAQQYCMDIILSGLRNTEISETLKSLLMKKTDQILSSAALYLLINTFEQALNRGLPSMTDEVGTIRYFPEQINPAVCVALPENSLLVCGRMWS